LADGCHFALAVWKTSAADRATGLPDDFVRFPTTLAIATGRVRATSDCAGRSCGCTESLGVRKARQNGSDRRQPDCHLRHFTGRSRAHDDHRGLVVGGERGCGNGSAGFVDIKGVAGRGSRVAGCGSRIFGCRSGVSERDEAPDGDPLDISGRRLIADDAELSTSDTQIAFSTADESLTDAPLEFRTPFRSARALFGDFRTPCGRRRRRFENVGARSRADEPGARADQRPEG
jgi:hypothetical protein